MSPLWLVAGLFLLFGFALIRFIDSRREIEQSQFEECIRWFVRTRLDGGKLTFEHAKTHLRVILVRQNQVNEGCEILIELPAPKWGGWRDRLNLELDRQLYEPNAELRDEENALELTILVPDVNAVDAGARTARALVLIFKVAGLGYEERFRSSSTGKHSLRTWEPTAERWVEEKNPLLRKVGKSTLRGLKEEEERVREGGIKDERDSDE